MLAYTDNTTLFHLNVLICLLICTLNRVSAGFMKVKSKVKISYTFELNVIMFYSFYIKKAFTIQHCKKSNVLH